MQNDPIYILDFDSTIITCESLDELARLALEKSPDKHDTLAELQALTAKGMEGKISFEESLAQRLELFRATKDHLQELTDYLYTCITPSLEARKDWLAQNKERIYIVSGGFEEYIRPIARSLGLRPENVYANRFTYSDDHQITGYDATRHTSRSRGKAAQIKSLGLSDHIIAIGDGYTDYEIKSTGEADQFWAFVEHVQRPGIAAKADRVLHSFTDI